MELGALVPVQLLGWHLPVCSPPKMDLFTFSLWYNGFSSFSKEALAGVVFCGCPVALKETKFSAWMLPCCTSWHLQAGVGRSRRGGDLLLPVMFAEMALRLLISHLSQSWAGLLMSGWLLDYSTNQSCFAGVACWADVLLEIPPAWNKESQERGAVPYNEESVHINVYGFVNTGNSWSSHTDPWHLLQAEQILGSCQQSQLGPDLFCVHGEKSVLLLFTMALLRFFSMLKFPPFPVVGQIWLQYILQYNQRQISISEVLDRFSCISWTGLQQDTHPNPASCLSPETRFEKGWEDFWCALLPEF